jgi:hypothetical protein
MVITTLSGLADACPVPRTVIVRFIFLSPLLFSKGCDYLRLYFIADGSVRQSSLPEVFL